MLELVLKARHYKMQLNPKIQYRISISELDLQAITKLESIKFFKLGMMVSQRKIWQEATSQGN